MIWCGSCTNQNRSPNGQCHTFVAVLSHVRLIVCMKTLVDY